MDKTGVYGEKFLILNNRYEQNSNYILLKGVNLGKIDRQCQKEHSNHTHVIVQEHTVSVHVLQPKLAARLLNVAVLKAERFLLPNS